MSQVAGEGGWDSGLQLERTALAWRRIALALLGLALAAPRFTWPLLEAWALLPAALAAAGALALLAGSHRRYHRSRRSLRDASRLPDGRLPLLASCATALLAALALVAVLSGVS